jgi:hypothetical protein
MPPLKLFLSVCDEAVISEIGRQRKSLYGWVFERWDREYKRKTAPFWGAVSGVVEIAKRFLLRQNS